MTRDVANSHKTAIGRTKPSAPARLLILRGLARAFSNRVLDYGCGRGFDAAVYGWDRYDPHYYPEARIFRDYHTILCSYVLNTLHRREEAKILAHIQDLLAPDGVAYITVRRNLKRNGFTSKGTYQRIVRLNLPIVEENSDYCIYRMDRLSQIAT